MWRDQKGDRREMAEAPEEHHSPPPATVGEVASQIQATCRDMSSLLEGHCKDVCEKDDRIRGDAAKVPPLPVLQACASGPAGRGGLQGGHRGRQSRASHWVASRDATHAV